jgi:hypothetical protein
MRKTLMFVTTATVAVAFVIVGTASAGPAGNRPVNVAFREFKFVGVPKNLPAGSTTFSFTNRGQFPHNFTILYVSKGGSKFKTKTLDAGLTQDLTVNLKPGSYIAVCTIFNGYHISQGMVKPFSVGKINQDTGQWEP